MYHPLETALLRAAAAAGCTTVDGLGMLVHQAVLQQQLWTGRRPDPASMRAAALAELARRAWHPSVGRRIRPSGTRRRQTSDDVRVGRRRQ